MRILVVEDEFLVAAAVEMALETLGHEVVGPAASVDAAIALLDREPPPDGAIVDLNLRGQPSVPVAAELARRHIPFAFATGYDIDADLEARFPGVQWLRKPYTDRHISKTLESMRRV
jgi:CheY-like chemotaxis protein